ncbi:MAG: chorismate synthase [Bacteroidetes bacterium]|nr:chorismate synthase [Bacteroidota bacterium]MBK8145676.1 chorismate synthase [Bacteroidota bacterium]MBP6313966.1 chorismate synthase [Chitinophagaceae bacterium]
MNSLGTLFKVISFGESHGSHVGCVLEGCPAGLSIDFSLIQNAVDKRKTAQNNFSSARKESDTVEIISGIFEGKTLGSPICILIKNEDAKSADYETLKDVFRPGHADASYFQKYTHRDYRGGGRSSIRITAPLVAAGEIARQLLLQYFNYESLTYISQIGEIALDEKRSKEIKQENIDISEVKCPDEGASQAMLTLIEQVREQGDTIGGVITTVIRNVPPGIGEPVFGKLQAALAHAMMSINTVKAFEYGEGFQSAAMRGSEHNDAFISLDENIATETNHHGGILGGISTGMDIRFKVWFKPISSIQQEQKTLDMNLAETNISIKGRHDVCAVPRAIPIVEAYTQIVLVDLFLQNKLSKI